jgi:ferredoxin like protein
MDIEDKLTKVRLNVDTGPHIKVDTQLCEICQEKSCLYVCPVQNYTLDDGKIVFSWQACMECGACRVACPKGAVTWKYPRGGFGVCLRYG